MPGYDCLDGIRLACDQIQYLLILHILRRTAQCAVPLRKILPLRLKAPIRQRGLPLGIGGAESNML